jgi:uncharacterized BrkB/YihY/UPF0761 family membrane protein
MSSPSSPRPRLGTIQQRLEAFQARMPGATTARGMFQRDRRHAGSVLAAGLAFRLFLMLLPFYLLGAAALGFLAGGRVQAASAAGRTLGLGGAVLKVVNDSAAQAYEGRWLLLLSGLVLLAYTANSACRALRLVHVVAWQDRIERAGALTTVLTALLVVALLLWLAVETVLVSRFPNAWPVIGVLLITVLGGTWLLVSMLLPHGGAPWRVLLPGAAVVAIGLGTMHLAGSYYIPRKLSNSSQLYGALGIAATVMTWLFLACRLIVAAAVLNAMLWERGRVLGGGPTETPSAAPDSEPWDIAQKAEVDR